MIEERLKKLADLGRELKEVRCAMKKQLYGTDAYNRLQDKEYAIVVDIKMEADLLVIYCSSHIDVWYDVVLLERVRNDMPIHSINEFDDERRASNKQ